MTRRPTLTLILGGRYEPPAAVQEARARDRLYPLSERRVRAQPRTDPTPPRAA